MAQPMPASEMPEHVHIERPVLNDFDLDVVDEAMLHPEKEEYIDHFGFRVRVKTDNEYDQDTSDSEYEDASSTNKNQNYQTDDASSVNDPVLPESNPNEDWQIVTSTPTLKSATSYYDILLSKFSRNSDSAKQVQLKKETSHNLELLKSSAAEQDTDWGKNCSTNDQITECKC